MKLKKTTAARKGGDGSLLPVRQPEPDSLVVRRLIGRFQLAPSTARLIAELSGLGQEARQ